MNFNEFMGLDTKSLKRALSKRNGRPFLITGPPGTGKTTLASLITRSYLCDNPSEDILCGRCPTCTANWHELSKAHPLINCHTVEDAANTKEILSQWLELNYVQPLDPSSRKRKRHIFILDELQMLRAAPQTLSQLLAPLEEESYRQMSVWILISMDYLSLPEKPRVAIASRCYNISLHSLSQEEIQKSLQKHPQVDESVARAISTEAYSRGNLRKAWSTLEALLDREEPLTEDLVHQLLSGGATPQSRQTFWRDLSSKSTSTQKQAIETLRGWKCDEDTISLLMEEDLLNGQYGEAGLEFCKFLAYWHSSSPRPPLWSLLLAFRGREVLKIDTPKVPNILLYRSIREFMNHSTVL